MKLFFDTSAFIALQDRSDGAHEAARRVYESLTFADRLFTSNYVVDETITRLRYTIGLPAALAFADAVLDGRLYRVLYVDEEVEAASLTFLKKYKDKRLSFTDATTISLVRENGLDAVFAFDEDFRKVGLRLLP